MDETPASEPSWPEDESNIVVMSWVHHVVGQSLMFEVLGEREWEFLCLEQSHFFLEVSVLY